MKTFSSQLCNIIVSYKYSGENKREPDTDIFLGLLQLSNNRHAVRISVESTPDVLIPNKKDPIAESLQHNPGFRSDCIDHVR